MLREEIERYTKLTGEDGKHVSIVQLGAYLDGYNKGLGVLDKIRAEIDGMEINGQVDEHTMFIRTGEQVKQMALEIIDKYRESEE